MGAGLASAAHKIGKCVQISVLSDDVAQVPHGRRGLSHKRCFRCHDDQ